MIQRRNNAVSILEADYSDEDEGITDFLERYKISKEECVASLHVLYLKAQNFVAPSLVA